MGLFTTMLPQSHFVNFSRKLKFVNNIDVQTFYHLMQTTASKFARLFIIYTAWNHGHFADENVSYYAAFSICIVLLYLCNKMYPL